MKFYEFEPSETKLFYEKIQQMNFNLNDFIFPITNNEDNVRKHSTHVYRAIDVKGHKYFFSFEDYHSGSRFRIEFYPMENNRMKGVWVANDISILMTYFEQWLTLLKKELKAEAEIKQLFEKTIKELPGMNINLNVSPESQVNILAKMKDVEKLIFELAEMQADELNVMSEKNEAINSKLEQIESKLNSINWKEILVSSAIGNIASVVSNPDLKKIIKNYFETHFGGKFLK